MVIFQTSLKLLTSALTIPSFEQLESLIISSNACYGPSMHYQATSSSYVDNYGVGTVN